MNQKSSNQAVVSQEYVIRVPKNTKKKFHAMKFNASLNIDFSKWTHVKMERENNIKEYKLKEDEDTPKFGAGSEFGKEQKEEARRKKYGIMQKLYKAEDQPWILKAGGKNGKKYRGIREGGVTENASYYVFTQAQDGAFEAFPIEEWYNFTPIQRFNALSAEEAEEEFGRRDKVMNYFSIMLKKRLKKEDEEDEEPSNKRSEDFMVTDMDEWAQSSDAEDSDEEADSEKKSTNPKVSKNKKKKKTPDSDDEGIEESDDGDDEGREVDYMSDTSSSEEELNVKESELKGVDEEDALHKLLASDEDEEEKQEETSDKDADEHESETEKDETKNKTKKNKKNKDVVDKNLSDSSEEVNTDSEPESSALFLQSKLKTEKDSQRNNAARSAAKHPHPEYPEAVESKKMKLDKASFFPSSSIANNNDLSINEESVRRYLMRKPMTTTELLQKFKSKKIGLSSDNLVTQIAQILKNINPVKKTIKGKMYLSIKN